MIPIVESTIARNYERILERIDRVARSAGRDLQGVRLVVVTKGHTVDAVRQVIAAGAQILGENYVEEAVPKTQAFSAESPVKWHMIGHVQSRKAQAVCEYFDWLHSLDRVKLARRLERSAAELERTLPVLLECNVIGEETKFGWRAWDESAWPDLAVEIEALLALNHLKVKGLMTMAPFLPDAEGTRPYFKRLRKLQEFLAARFPGQDWSELSMGMSADFEVAIQEGATLVRIGTAIMGPRPD